MRVLNLTFILVTLTGPAAAAPIDIVCQGAQRTSAGVTLPQLPSTAQIDLDQRILKTEFGSFGISEFDDKLIKISDGRVDGLERLSVSGTLDRLSGRLRLVWRSSLHSAETVGEYSCSKATQRF